MMRVTAIALLLVFFAPLPIYSMGKAEKPPAYREGELLVKFKVNVQQERAYKIIEGKGAEIIKFMKSIMVYHIRLRRSQKVHDAVKEFSTIKEVEYAEPNYKMKKQE